MKSRTVRIAVFITAVALLAGCYRMAGRWLEMGPQDNRAVVTKNVMVTMRDGVRLATDVYEPADREGTLPVIMTRLPYNKNYLAPVGKLFAQRGYVFVAQDCRACFASEGEVFVPFAYEGEDGMDTVRWITEQPWCNGSLGTWGPSYLGAAQWAVAADNPWLKAFYPQITSARLDQLIFTGGAFSYRLSTGWSSGVGKQHDSGSPMPTAEINWDTDGFFNLPLQPGLPIKWEEFSNASISELSGRLAAAWDMPAGETPPDMVERMIEYMNYPAFAEYADAFNFHDRYKNVNAPALMVSGWFDIFVAGQLEDWKAMKAMAPGDAGKFTRIIVGPWGHVSGVAPGVARDAKLGAMIKDFMVIAWYDRFMKGEQNGIENEAPVKIYVMGKNVWRDEQEWPLARARYTPYYLRSQGGANGRDGDGALSTEAPAAEPADKFSYDPRDPVPSVGGNNLLEDVGTKDQAAVEKRNDVLIFSTPPLERDLEITGPITAVIHAASSAVDTDFTVKLCDVHPGGKSMNLAEGIVRARYRDSLTEPSLIEPGKIYEYHVEIWPTSNCFRKGHRVRVQVSSSSFPRFDRNANAGGEGGPMNVITARQTIYHDAAHPSHILLPVIP